MASFTNILVLVACIAMASLIFVPQSGGGKAFAKIQNASEQMQASGAGIQVSAPIIGTQVFPNFIGFFSGIVNVMFTSVGAVTDVFGSFAELPAVVKALILVIFMLSLTVAVWGFWKGTNQG